MDWLQTIARKVSGGLGRESWLVRRVRPRYEDFLGFIRQGTGINWPINGINYRIDPHYRHQMGSNYDPAVAAFLRERVQPGATCLDVGANVGVYVLQLAHWAGPDGHIVAFEPNPAARAVLERHINFNALAERVTVVPAAVSATPGEAVLYAAAADGMSRLGAPNRALAARTQEIKVPVVTLDEVCAAAGWQPDWLVIDIEGWEIAALRGARELIRQGRGKLGLIVEMHPNMWASASTNLAEARMLITELGLQPIPLTGQKDPLADYGLVYLAYL